ncbi:amino acid racemase [Clostridiaceae bacterium 35-E11]
MQKTLGIIGGMGPLATADLFKKIVLLTDAKRDQEHLHILIDNNTAIPDRTAYILGSGEKPTKYLIDSAKKLENMGAEYLIMPCNTAHYFYEEIVKEINIPFLNMIEETARFIKYNFSTMHKVGLLATDGTCISGIYDQYFNKFNIPLMKPDKVKQPYIMDLIYDIKSGKRDISLDRFYQTLEDLKQAGVEIFILGCTELSSAHEIYQFEGNFADPLEIIAKSAIRFGKNI